MIYEIRAIGWALERKSNSLRHLIPSHHCHPLKCISCGLLVPSQQSVLPPKSTFMRKACYPNWDILHVLISRTACSSSICGNSLSLGQVDETISKPSWSYSNMHRGEVQNKSITKRWLWEHSHKLELLSIKSSHHSCNCWSRLHSVCVRTPGRRCQHYHVFNLSLLEHSYKRWTTGTQNSSWRPVCSQSHNNTAAQKGSLLGGKLNFITVWKSLLDQRNLAYKDVWS